MSERDERQNEDSLKKNAAQKSIFCFNNGCSQVQPPAGIFQSLGT